jgi:hypothetical protein
MRTKYQGQVVRILIEFFICEVFVIGEKCPLDFFGGQTSVNASVVISIEKI